ncbi:hypothetical protein ACFLZ5_07440 [Thermodesulfobacteriota bacterium]
MQFKQELQPGILIKRYKRFLADIEFEDKKMLMAYCPNTGSMRFQMACPLLPLCYS